ARAYLDAKHPAKALPLLHASLAEQKRQLGDTNPRLAGVQATLALALLNAGEPAAAEPILRECLTIRFKEMPDHWLTFNTRSMLGGALLAQKKYKEAEPLLLQGYEGLKERHALLPVAARIRLTEALERLGEVDQSTTR